MKSLNSRQESTIALPKKYKYLYPIDASQQETTFLPEVVSKLGKRNLLKLLNNKLDNSRFEVQFGFKHVKRTLTEGEFTDLALFHHKLILPKPKHVLATTAAIEKVLDVDGIVEDELTITYDVYLGEGPFANTISETVSNINHVLGPVVENSMQQIGVTDYKLIFIISLAY
ncbi:hypothetical protein [Lysinibacillus sp.]|uniref:hypothetical protein n=1 Tax=Lysinibacillus sp. TaxID=1869345 RepID=UPI002898BA65|nr:hypothetical protein [Lysinibacillus sp.]